MLYYPLSTFLLFGIIAWFVASRVTKSLAVRVGTLETQLALIESNLLALSNQRRATGAAGEEESSAEALPVRSETAAPKPPEEIVPGVEASVPPIQRNDALPPQRELLLKTGGLEEKLGAKWAVWVGGVALALGGIFLVRYAIDMGLLGPGTRLLFGALLAAFLIALGEWLRRTKDTPSIAILSSADIPSILTAAGTVVAFATVYAAHALYGFIGPAFAFVLLGAVAIVAMLAAAIHGPALAGLGLVGALVTPLLVSSNAPNPIPVAVYLAIVTTAAYALARIRRWVWLASAAIVGAVLWGLVFVTNQGTDAQSWQWAAIGHALAQLGLGAFFLAFEPNAGKADHDARLDFVATLSLAGLAALCVAVLAGVPFEFEGWLPFAALAMLVLVAVAWLSAPSAWASVLAGLVGLAATVIWPGLVTSPPESHLWPLLEEAMPIPANVSLYLTFAALSAIGVASPASLRLWTGRTLPAETAAPYALAATAIPLLTLIVVYVRVTQFDQSIPFAIFGLLLGVAFSWLAGQYQSAGVSTATQARELATGAFAAAAIAAMSFALVTSLSRGYLTVAFALSALGVAYVANLKNISVLRYAVTALGLVVLGRVAWDPRIMGEEVGTMPIFNWILFGYGVPAVAFALAARLLSRRRDDLAVRLCDALGILFAGLLSFFEIRHALNGGDPLNASSGYLEQGLLTFTGFGTAYVLTRLDLAKPNTVFYFASLAYGVLAAAIGVGGLVLFYNPLFSDEPVIGAPFLSSLIPAYLLPGLAALYVARTSRGRRPSWYTTGSGILGLVLILLFVSLEVRHIFQGQFISLSHSSTDAEQWAYSAAWLALGILYLAYGIWRGSPEARMASAALIVLATVKVFVFDLSGVTGIWRAFSFIGLGAVLMGVGFVYQKIISAEPRPTREDGPSARST